MMIRYYYDECGDEPLIENEGDGYYCVVCFL